MYLGGPRQQMCCNWTFCIYNAGHAISAENQRFPIFPKIKIMFFKVLQRRTALSFLFCSTPILLVHVPLHSTFWFHSFPSSLLLTLPLYIFLPYAVNFLSSFPVLHQDDYYSFLRTQFKLIP